MTDELLTLAASEAFMLSRRWPRVERDDIRQEILLWAVENGVDGAELSEELGDDEYAEVRRALKFKLREAGAQFCKKTERERRRERAAALGYEVDDEAFYSAGQLRLLVEQYFAHGITEHPPIGRAESVSKHSGDPAEGGNWTASLLDVQRGLMAVPAHYCERLYDRLNDNAHLTDEEYGWLHGLTEHQVRGRLRTALQALQKELGGQNPWNRGPTPKMPEAA